MVFCFLLFSFNCFAKKLGSSGNYKIVDKTILEDNLPKIFVTGLQNTFLKVEKKNKGLTKGAKIGIIVGACVLIGICVSLIILFKLGIFRKGNSEINAGYAIAPDKSRNIGPGEIKDNQSGAIMIRKQNDKNRI